MIVTFWKGIFVVDKPEDRPVLTKAGFEPHEPSLCTPDKRCKACYAKIGNRWWSNRVESATRLRAYCNQLALAAIKTHVDKLAKSRAVTSNIVVPSPPGLKYAPYQLAGIAFIRDHKDTLLGDDMGLGKDQPLDAKILTPYRWTTMGEVKKGQLIIGSDGRSYPIEGVYPQGKQKIYRVTLENGASTECGEEHLWEVHTHTDSLVNCRPKILTTKQIIDAGLRNTDNRPTHLIPTRIDYINLGISKPIRLRFIDKIEFVGMKESQCIAVRSPDHLYVTDDYILTHNTIQALGFVNHMRSSDPKPKSVLIVCPSTLRFNWRQEIERWLVKPMTVVIPTGPKFEVPKQDNIVVITNYEKLIGVNPFTESLKRVWDVLVCDEAQALKTWNTKRSQAILGREGLLQHAHRFLALTGTPIENYPKEIWPLAAAICPAKFGDRIAFLKRYCALHDEKRGGRVVAVDTGATNLGELQQRLRASFMLRRLKGDVLKELPPKRRQLVILNDAQADWSRDPDFRRWRELYERDYEAKLAALEAAKTHVEYRLAVRALDEFTGVAFQEMSDFRHRTALAKLPACIEYVDDMLAAGLDKLVIFAHHQDVLAKLAEHYGDQAVSLHGATRQQDREKVVRAFQDGDKKIFIGGLKAAGIGLNLYAASTVVFIEIDWNPAVLSQAEDRLCRMGQKKMVHVIHLVLDGTLDVNICKRVVAKQQVIDKALNRLPDHGIKMPTTLPLPERLSP
jgi:SWI/SNF-related matrix-associated actin-dependent regulator 1 of chromatin subfamily A